MNPSLVMYVALGGAVGAVGRYGVSIFVTSIAGFGFPYGTLCVNIIGSLVLGIFIEVSALAWSPSHEIRTFIVVGVLGSFTTFSMFSLDVVSLMTRGETVPALIYMASSVLLSIGAIWLGLMVTRVLIS